MADISRINAIIAYTDGSISNFTSADDGQVFQISLTDFATTESELFSWPSFRAFMESIGINLGVAIDVTHIRDIVWSVTITDETGTRVVSSFNTPGDPPGGTGTNSNTPYDPATFPNFDGSISDLVDMTATATATMTAVSVPSMATIGSSYRVAQDIVLTGGTFSTAATLAIDSVSSIVGQDETVFGATETQGTFTGGSGYSVNNVNTMSDGSTITVNAVSTGAVTEFTVTTASTSGNGNDTTLTQTGSTGEGATGFTLTLDDENQGIFAASVKLVAELPQGGEYTVIPSNPVTQGSTTGSGSGATFNMDWGVKAVTVTDGGQGYESAPAVSFSGGSGSAATATLTDDAVSSITVTVAGSGHSERTTVTVAAPA